MLGYRSKCLSVSQRNMKTLDVVDDYSLEWNTDFASTIFRIIREYDKEKKANTFRSIV
tara:strand:+ start:658 stop:831 length:174 start_codon:yes stop_codon:yes gene_type:complete